MSLSRASGDVSCDSTSLMNIYIKDNIKSHRATLDSRERVLDSI